MKTIMPLIFCLILIISVSQCNQRSDTSSSQMPSIMNGQSITDLVERGNYLVTVIGCDHCHTPKIMTPEGPVPDMNRWLMGYPAQEKLPEINKMKLHLVNGSY